MLSLPHCTVQCESRAMSEGTCVRGGTLGLYDAEHCDPGFAVYDGTFHSVNVSRYKPSRLRLNC